MKSSSQRYGSVAMAIHWLSALAVVALLASGQVMAGSAPERLGKILPIHVSLGLVVGLLTLVRIVWWLALDRRPRPEATLGPVQRRLAGAVHGLLYLSLIVMVASGIAMLALTGALPVIFGGGVLPDFEAVPPFAAHSLVSKLLLALAVGHIGAALYHQFIRRDRLIERMWPGRA
ncbi:cytochrome b [Devosia sp. PTR5]|uniref:Cytochrome b n=1 Tax=Devosia oryzisoli TaxID=2774138 RepID=A0A927IUB1_9HYPH|nr:cytochrome b [Devosia oryzisoli]